MSTSTKLEGLPATVNARLVHIKDVKKRMVRQESLLEKTKAASQSRSADGKARLGAGHTEMRSHRDRLCYEID